MKPDQLHEFVKNLNRPEVVACRASAHLTTGKWQVQRRILFDKLLDMDTYEPYVLTTALNNGDYLKMLSIEKYRMLRSLMATLIDLRRRRESTTDPWLRLDECRLLDDMGLADAAITVANEGIALAEKVEDVFAELQLREQLRIAYKRVSRAANMERITENEYRLETVVRKVANLTHYALMGDKMLDHYKKFRVADDAAVRATMDSLMADPQLADMKHALSLPAQTRLAATRSLYYEATGNLNEAKLNIDLSLQLWESNPHRIAYLPHLYRQALSNRMGLAARLGEPDLIPGLLERMQQVTVHGRRASVMAFCEFELQYQLYYMNIGQFAKVLEREDELIRGLTLHGKMVPESRVLTLLYNLGVTHLVLGNNKGAKGIFSRIRDMGKLESRLDLQGLARLLRLLLLFEEDRDGNFGYFLRSNKRTFRKGMPFYQLEDTVYNWISEHQHNFHNMERKEALMQLYTRLEEFEKQRLVGAEEMRLWALSRATGKTVHQLLLEKTAEKAKA